MLKALRRRARLLVDTLQRQRRAVALEKTEPHVTRAQLAADLRQLGLRDGDAVFIHSSLKSLGFVEGGPTSVIQALRDVVGDSGTLVLPTYYMPGGTILATCELPDYVFDPRVHGTNMGAMPAAFLATPGVRRSVHPTHSVSALGHHAEHLTEAHHRAPSVFGIGSPWQRFVELDNAKVLGLGISMGPVTFYHLVEDALGERFPIKVWLDKTFHVPCRDAGGGAWTVPVRPYDPLVTARRIDHPGRSDLRAWFAAEFEATGLKVNGRVGQGNSWVIPARAFFDHLVLLARDNITIYSEARDLAEPARHAS